MCFANKSGFGAIALHISHYQVTMRRSLLGFALIAPLFSWIGVKRDRTSQNLAIALNYIQGYQPLILG
ncbi:MAG: hypothetical protein RM022_030145 [Nostoc sp. EfeVER01]|uniref:hypothetical protein n=1 Tax=unclassified Nostoc TaxID=2593658 RepID=UPI002AD593DF|nr:MULTISPECIES: hypothetical protein [unclassified Nostoc]MDZ7946001.1 hypothetical protein [Nostoc sp. EfeVER01]MDZ7995146.1 hypothetical protein [Nostoc sp. EspVER01]